MPRSRSLQSVGVVGAALLVFGCAQVPLRQPAQQGAPCPLAGSGETKSDCPWAGWVRDYETGVVSASDLPEEISSSLMRDRSDSALHDAWGMSLNFDSGARAEIVTRGVLEELAARFGVALSSGAGRTIQHAGLIHTYGYLLSNLQTPFGYKRARWVGGVVDRGLGLPAGTLGPERRGETTLLSRATALFMRVATHQDSTLSQAWEQRLAPRAGDAVRRLRLPPISRKTETYRLKSGERVELVTDLVELPRDSAGARLLVYSVRRGREIRLITGFPVDSGFRERPGNPARPRYNAWLE